MDLRPLAADPSGQLALDANALAGLRAQARAAPAEAAGKAAGQFEALFLQMLMKQMRDALPQDGPLSSDTMKGYTALFDQQIAQHLSNRGIGLRKVIEQQLARQIAAAGSPADSEPLNRAPTSSIPGLQKLAAQTKSTAGVATMPSTATPPAIAAGGSLLPASVEAFIERMRPHAEAVARAVGVPVHYLLAQAGLETGWGKSLPRTADGTTSHNLFGIKAGSQWKGAVAESATTEVVDGESVRSVERFRAYGSFSEAFQDFGTLLRDSARYAGVIASVASPRAYADGLQRAGYATDPQYGAKLARSIELVARKLGVQPPRVQVAPAPADRSSMGIQGPSGPDRPDR